MARSMTLGSMPEEQTDVMRVSLARRGARDPGPDLTAGVERWNAAPQAPRPAPTVVEAPRIAEISVRSPEQVVIAGSGNQSFNMNAETARVTAENASATHEE